ncbi:hypothetical protein [Niabella hibiscisoli]|uniref:hypothetical protein n=1 Tax=Niabella hibiscisoli TaxID=1825928 RepID=UPI001F0D7FB9|nr:hypothetical protein [Niabella hibiscisoli]MCH5715239.1 hypothetical protein [Niabella hibiscisoli]
MCRAFDIYGQADVVMLTDPKKPQSLQKVSFRFAPGDNPKWADPLFLDSSWQVVGNTAFGTDQYSDAALPKGWNGVGWFRIWLKKRATL